MRANRVLITGATGFLGRHVLDYAGARQVIALVRDPSRWPYDTAPTLLRGELDSADWHKEARDVDTVVHLAGHVHHSRSYADDSYRINVDGALAMVRYAAKVGARLVMISTSGVVGCSLSPQDCPDEDAPYVTQTVRRWPYYHSKLLAEQGAIELAETLSVPLVILRPPMLYGPGDHRFRTTNMAVKILRGKFPAHIPGGVAFTDIRDVASAVWAAAEHSSPRRIYHLPGEACTVGEFFESVAQLGGVKPPRLSIPYPVAKTLAVAAIPLNKLTGRHLMPDPVVVEMGRHYWGLDSKYADELGFSPRPAEQTLRDTVAWLTEHHPDMGVQTPG